MYLLCAEVVFDEPFTSSSYANNSSIEEMQMACASQNPLKPHLVESS